MYVYVYIEEIDIQSNSRWFGGILLTLLFLFRLCYN